MVNLELELDEGIVLQATEVERYGIKELSLNEMVLTNKNIVCVYEKSTGLFSKPETIIEKIPLSTIKVANGQAQVMVHDSDEYGKGLQVLFISGHREHFVFSDSPKKTMPLWINEINKILIGEPTIPVQVENTEPTYSSESKPKKSFLGGLAGALGSLDIQSAMDKAQEKIGQFANQIQGEFSQSQQQEVNYSEPQVQPQEQPPIPPQPQEHPTESANETAPNINAGKVLFCSNCGTKLNEGSKFCHGCGVAVGTVQKEASPVPPPVSSTQYAEQPNEGHYKERQQEYVGKVLKCPNCGGVINETTAICPECGMQITGKSAVSSVQAFKEQLMSIESHRKKAFGGMFGIYGTADPADKQKLSLIRNFPIPNSIDDILEFMMLAIANIDVSLSKKTWTNSGQNMEVLAIEMPKVISNAWVQKMEQCYKKAEIAFPKDPAFEGIQKMYFEKMKELKIKVN